MKYIKIFFILFFNLYIISAEAQTETQSSIDFHENAIADTGYWIPTLLSAGHSVVYQLSSFSGYPFGWIPRGQQDRTATYINGVNWNSKNAGWNSSMTYAGAFKLFRQEEFSEQYRYTQKGVALQSGVNYFSSSAIPYRKSIQFGNRFTNNFQVNESFINHSSGKLKRNWYVHSVMVIQNSTYGVLPIGYKKLNVFAISIDKIIKQDQKIGISFWRNQSSQGRQSPAVKEAFLLSGNNNYNPNWGWLSGAAIYPSTKENNVPVTMLYYDRQWNDSKFFNINLGYAWGVQKKSQLDWTQTKDPRPDYYKYLPSYGKDSLLQKSWTNWLLINPSKLQVNFDEIERINKSSPNGRAYYIINTGVVKSNLFRAGLNYRQNYHAFWSWDMHVNIAIDKSHYYNQLRDLLGAKFYYNYNSWINDDGATNSFENDISNPNQKVQEGDIWGPNYSITNWSSSLSAQLKFQKANFESSLSILGINDQFFRQGFNKNGLFTSRSYGPSAILNFNALGIKYAYLYKFSGRFYGSASFYKMPESINAQAIYIDPNIQDQLASFIQPASKQGIDFSLIYHGVPEKIQLNFYWQKNAGQYGHVLFYHDYYNAFVYGFYGQMETSFKGIEFSFETDLFSLIQLQATSTFGKYQVLNNPIYEIKLLNDLYKVESGILKIKGLPASTSPETVQAISLRFQPSYSVQIGLTAVYEMNRFVDYDYFRRSANLLSQLKEKKLHQTVLQVSKLPSQFVLNAFFAKSFNFNLPNSILQIRSSLNVRNCLNETIPVLSFEQTRFDYLKYNINKFPIKYLYDQGLVFALGIQFQIQ
jgi:hypothetical protein